MAIHLFRVQIRTEDGTLYWTGEDWSDDPHMAWIMDSRATADMAVLKITKSRDDKDWINCGPLTVREVEL